MWQKTSHQASQALISKGFDAKLHGLQIPDRLGSHVWVPLPQIAVPDAVVGCVGHLAETAQTDVEA